MPGNLSEGINISETSDNSVREDSAISNEELRQLFLKYAFYDNKCTHKAPLKADEIKEYVDRVITKLSLFKVKDVEKKNAVFIIPMVHADIYDEAIAITKSIIANGGYLLVSTVDNELMFKMRTSLNIQDSTYLCSFGVAEHLYMSSVHLKGFDIHSDDNTVGTYLDWLVHHVIGSKDEEDDNNGKVVEKKDAKIYIIHDISEPES